MVSKKILVTGGTGMVGSGFKYMRSHHDFLLVGSMDYDLRDLNMVENMLEKHSPDMIIHLAARVGGVKGNTDFVADFFRDNILINTNVLYAAHKFGVEKVISLLSTCVYPDKASYPLTPSQFHDGPPHVSNYGYAYAKRMVDVYSRALRQQHGCNFICAVPNNLYGPYDNFDLENGHVIPAIIRKIWEAKHTGKVPKFWGDGSALREFTYSRDICDILLFLLENYDNENSINIGHVQERSIKSVVEEICKCLRYDGEIAWDLTKPMGQLRKPSSNEKLIQLGWNSSGYTSFEEGIKLSCDWFVENYPNVRGVS